MLSISSVGRAFLKDFAKRYNARVDVSKTRGIVRITADQATARSVYQNIKKVLSNVARMEVDLQPLQALLEKVDGGLRRLRGSTRDKISELTGTEIDFSEDGRKVRISISALM